MSERFETCQFVPFPVELVFAFFANPSNLPHLMPPQLKTRLEDARIQPPPPRPVAADPSRRFLSVAAGVGSEILISFRPMRGFPRRVSWLAHITEFAWNSHFCDEQVRGPFSVFHHRHGIEPQTRNGLQGTLVSDRIDFELPYGWFGQIGAGMVRRQFRHSFAYRQKRLEKILAAAASQAARRA